MLFSKYVNRASNLFIENRFNKFVVAVLTLIILAQLWMMNNSFRRHNVYLIPPGLNSKVSVSGHAFDPNYLQAMGVYSGQLLYTFTPYSVVNQYEELTSLFSADCYQENGKELLTTANDYKENEISMSFSTLEIRTFKNPDIIEITGEVTKSIVGEKVKTYKTTMNIHYTNQNGLFRITAIGEKLS
jgi:type IV conjugative transfer system protein TraE